MTRRHSRWNDLKAKARQRWQRLTSEDIDGVRGNLERLVDALRLRYGYDRRSAEREIFRWSRTLSGAGS
jgi:hypothetical protein